MDISEAELKALGDLDGRNYVRDHYWEIRATPIRELIEAIADATFGFNCKPGEQYFQYCLDIYTAERTLNESDSCLSTLTCRRQWFGLMRTHCHRALREFVVDSVVAHAKEIGAAVLKKRDSNRLETIERKLGSLTQLVEKIAKITLQLQAASAAQAPDDPDVPSCCVCMNVYDSENVIQTNFKCSHSTCASCVSRIQKCPLCRAKIELVDSLSV